LTLTKQLLGKSLDILFGFSYFSSKVAMARRHERSLQLCTQLKQLRKSNLKKKNLESAQGSPTSAKKARSGIFFFLLGVHASMSHASSTMLVKQENVE